MGKCLCWRRRVAYYTSMRYLLTWPRTCVCPLWGKQAKKALTSDPSLSVLPLKKYPTRCQEQWSTWTARPTTRHGKEAVKSAVARVPRAASGTERRRILRSRADKILPFRAFSVPSPESIGRLFSRENRAKLWCREFQRKPWGIIGKTFLGLSSFLGMACWKPHKNREQLRYCFVSSSGILRNPRGIPIFFHMPRMNSARFTHGICWDIARNLIHSSFTYARKYHGNCTFSFSSLLWLHSFSVCGIFGEHFKATMKTN